MKKFIFISLMVAGMISSCANEPRMNAPDDGSSSKTLSTKAEQLIAKAQQARALFYPTQSRSVSADATIEYVVSRNSRSEADTLLSIVNFVDNQGFVIMTDKAEVPEILAVTDNGNLIPELNDNPGLQQYLDNAEAVLSALPSRGPGGTVPLDPTKPYLCEYVEYYDTIYSIAPKVTVRWGQDGPYNLACPLIDGKRAKAGCVPIAVAQAMTHFKYPSSFVWNIDGASSTIILDWTEINRHVGLWACNDAGVAHESISKLVRKLGEQLDANYGINGTTADHYRISPTLQSYGYVVSNFINFKTTEVYNGNSIWIMYGVGTNPDTGERYAHTYIVDGRNYVRYVTEERILDPSTNPPTIVDAYNRTETNYDYLHVNWGWDGISNGYFYYGTFNSSNPISLDDPYSGTNNDNFTSGLKYIKVSR